MKHIVALDTSFNQILYRLYRILYNNNAAATAAVRQQTPHPRTHNTRPAVAGPAGLCCPFSSPAPRPAAATLAATPHI